jgi:hypothetical protein
MSHRAGPIREFEKSNYSIFRLLTTTTAHIISIDAMKKENEKHSALITTRSMVTMAQRI